MTNDKQQMTDRKFPIRRFVICHLLFVIGAAAAAEVNVRNFGAHGDGVMDDTGAIRQAADEAKRQRKLVPGMRGGEFSYPAIVFPAGRYLLSAPVDFDATSELRGLGGAVIHQTVATESFRWANGYDVTVSGLTFIGGTTAIQCLGQNVNGARLTVNRCRFQATTGPAVIVAPVQPGNLSSQILLTDCRWLNCRQMLVSHADRCVVSNSWIQWGGGDDPPKDQACLDCVRGALTLRELLFVPEFPGGANGCRWIDQRGLRLTATDCRFGGEYAGLPIVHQWGVPDVGFPFQGPVISFRDCQLSSGRANHDESAVLTLRGGLPQTLIVDGCSGLIGPVPLIRDQDLKSEAVLTGLKNGPARVRITLGTNTFFPLTPAVPSWLVPYRKVLSQ